MKKDFTSGEYWYNFGRGTLLGDNKPTPKEAADYITSLHVQIDKLTRENADLEKKAKVAGQQFKVFAMEVSNLANKYSI